MSIAIAAFVTAAAIWLFLTLILVLVAGEYVEEAALQALVPVVILAVLVAGIFGLGALWGWAA